MSRSADSVSYVERATIEMDRCECDAPEVRDDTVRYPDGEELDVETCMECGGVRNYRWYDFEDTTATEVRPWSDQVVIQVTDVVAIFSGVAAGLTLAHGVRSAPTGASVSETFGALDPLALAGAVAFLVVAICVKTYANSRVLGGGAGV